MMLAVDVDYRDDGSASAAGVLFAGWTAGQAERVIRKRIETVAPYRPGYFFERELPCILALLGEIEPPEAIVVDGYVWLGAERRPGLGTHLFEATGIPVVGIAKTAFAGTPPETEVLRGASAKPLYVTAIGMDEGLARERVRAMHGEHRVPTLLTLADRACREG